MDVDTVEPLITDAINEVLKSIPENAEEIKKNISALKVDNMPEFAYGMIMGMVMGVCSLILSTQLEELTDKDYMLLKKILYNKTDMIRERVFEQFD